MSREFPGKDESFVCDICGDTWVSTNSHEEALEKAEKEFGKKPLDQWAIICDDCGVKFHRWMAAQGMTVN